MDKKSFAKNIVTYLVFAVLSFLFLFVWNPFQLALYSLFTGWLICIVTNKLKFNVVKYLSYSGLTYLLLITLYAVSPFLRLKEFQLLHRNYHMVEGNISDAAYGVYKQRGNLYSFVDIAYSYDENGKHYEQRQEKALRFYSFPIFSPTSAGYLKSRVNQEFQQIRQEGSYVILVNNDQPGKSKFFSSRKIFYWSGSMLKNFLAGILLMILVVALVGLTAYLFRNYKPPAPANRKAVVKLLWKILFGIFGLFLIIYLVLLIYFKSTGKL